MKILAIIPARGGSKGIPRKNIRPLCGKPLIAWTIEQAIQSKLLNRVIISTEDEEIAQISRQYGAEVPFLRPAELAMDDTTSVDTLIHAVQWLENEEQYHPNYIMLLQPTSPLRIREDIEAVVKLAQEKQADTVVTVCPVRDHPYWTKKLTDNQQLADFLSLENISLRRQDLPPVYALNGAIYLAKRDVFLSKKSFYTDQTYGYIMPIERSIDIDTEWDLYLADLILRDKYGH
jgi:N-acylneuraminate cytidylyltransferase/CMP-N,N'-diacetyllegionaminic acid synthase